MPFHRPHEVFSARQATPRYDRMKRSALRSTALSARLVTGVGYSSSKDFRKGSIAMGLLGNLYRDAPVMLRL
jgi:hypothetical protein